MILPVSKEYKLFHVYDIRGNEFNYEFGIPHKTPVLDFDTFEWVGYTNNLNSDRRYSFKFFEKPHSNIKGYIYFYDEKNSKVICKKVWLNLKDFIL